MVSENDNWYYFKNNCVNGPVDSKQLQLLCKQGVVRALDPVTAAAWDIWCLAGEVSGLQFNAREGRESEVYPEIKSHSTVGKALPSIALPPSAAPAPEVFSSQPKFSHCIENAQPVSPIPQKMNSADNYSAENHTFATARIEYVGINDNQQEQARNQVNIKSYLFLGLVTFFFISTSFLFGVIKLRSDSREKQASQQTRESRMLTAGQALGQHLPADWMPDKVLLLLPPQNSVGKKERHDINALAQGLKQELQSRQILLQQKVLELPTVLEAKLTQKRASTRGIDRWLPPLQNWFSGHVLDEVLQENYDSDLIISCAGLPRDAITMNFWNDKKAEHHNNTRLVLAYGQLPDLNVLATSGKIAIILDTDRKIRVSQKNKQIFAVTEEDSCRLFSFKH